MFKNPSIDPESIRDSKFPSALRLKSHEILWYACVFCLSAEGMALFSGEFAGFRPIMNIETSS